MKVLFIDSVHPRLWEQLSEHGFECIDVTDFSGDALLPFLPEVEGIVIRSKFRMDAAFMKKCPQLKFIARSGSGMENIDSEYAHSRGIKLYNSPEGNCDAVGEHAIGMLLSLLNNLCRGDREVREMKWRREENRGYELAYMKVGIIGYGHTGSAFARKLSGFGCEIFTYDKYKKGFGSDRVKESKLEDLQSNCDVISLHLPLTEETKFFFDDRFLEKMKKPFFLINTSRGQVVRTSTVTKGLKTEKIRGAALDVLEYEKSSFEQLKSDQLPEGYRALIQNDKVLLSPHVAGWTVESYYKLSDFLAQKILQGFA